MWKYRPHVYVLFAIMLLMVFIPFFREHSRVALIQEEMELAQHESLSIEEIKLRAEILLKDAHQKPDHPETRLVLHQRFERLGGSCRKMYAGKNNFQLTEEELRITALVQQLSSVDKNLLVVYQKHFSPREMVAATDAYYKKHPPIKTASEFEVTSSKRLELLWYSFFQSILVMFFCNCYRISLHGASFLVEVCSGRLFFYSMFWPISPFHYLSDGKIAKQTIHALRFAAYFLAGLLSCAAGGSAFAQKAPSNGSKQQKSTNGYVIVGAKAEGDGSPGELLIAGLIHRKVVIENTLFILNNKSGQSIDETIVGGVQVIRNRQLTLNALVGARAEFSPTSETKLFSIAGAQAFFSLPCKTKIALPVIQHRKALNGALSKFTVTGQALKEITSKLRLGCEGGFTKTFGDQTKHFVGPVGIIKINNKISAQFGGTLNQDGNWTVFSRAAFTR